MNSFESYVVSKILSKIQQVFNFIIDNNIDCDYLSRYYKTQVNNIKILETNFSYEYVIEIVLNNYGLITRDVRYEFIQFKVDIRPEERFDPNLLANKVLEKLKWVLIKVPDTEMAKILYEKENT